MCQFLSGWISLDGGTVYAGDLVHHERGADIHGISEAVACPWEWTAAGLSVVLSPKAIEKGATEPWYRELLREKFGDRAGAIDWCLEHLSPAVKTLDLRGTGITSLPDLPAVKTLDLRGTGITSLPDLPAVEWLDLSGTGITSLPDLPRGCRVVR